MEEERKISLDHLRPEGWWDLRGRQLTRPETPAHIEICVRFRATLGDLPRGEECGVRGDALDHLRPEGWWDFVVRALNRIFRIEA